MFYLLSWVPVTWRIAGKKGQLRVELKCALSDFMEQIEARIRKVLRPATSTQVFLVFLGPRRKCWDGSHFSSKLPLDASHVALPN